MHRIGIIAAALLLLPALATAEEGRLTVELNKTEDVDTGCRSYFLFRNSTDLTLAAFEMSLAIMNTEGVIDRLLTIDAAPLPAERTTLKLFEIPETDCGSIGEILLHDIASCRPQNGEERDCFGLVDLSSRADAPLVK